MNNAQRKVLFWTLILLSPVAYLAFSEVAAKTTRAISLIGRDYGSVGTQRDMKLFVGGFAFLSFIGAALYVLAGGKGRPPSEGTS